MASRQNIKLPTDLARTAREKIAKGSLSFHMASKLLPKTERVGIHFLYAWCRYIDDRADHLPLSTKQAEKEALINSLKQETVTTLVEKGYYPNAELHGLDHIVKQYQIPHHYVFELIEGVSMDLRGYEYKSFADLYKYCYRVAGVVGLMCCHILGIDNEDALEAAESLGVAMQLTNIARDLKEDEENNRCYIPSSWCKNYQNYPHFSDKERSVIARQLIATAESYYSKGESGIKHLPLRAAFAVASARHIYAAIGEKVLLRGDQAWSTRTWIPTGQKLRLILRGLVTVCKTIPYRISNFNRKPVQIQKIRRFN